jgi:hypothetical protein
MPRTMRHKKIKTRLKEVGLVALITVAGMELAAAAAVEFFKLPVVPPSYRLPRLKRFQADLNPYFGVWHLPNATLNHRASCFNVIYRSNSYGARDKERPITADRSRVVMLGDSFLEGVGLSRAKRLSDLLEAYFHTPHLNFGTSGDFGPTQMYLLYRHLAKTFTHDRVIVTLLPDNDFLDDDLEFGRLHHKDRYRPYFVRADSGYKLVYFDKSKLAKVARGYQEKLNFLDRQWRTVVNFSYALSAIDYLARRSSAHYKERKFLRESSGDKPRSFYYDYRPAMLQKLKYVLSLIFDEAGVRPVLIVLIARPMDIARYRQERPAPLTRALTRFVSTRPNVEVLDLLPVFAAKPDWRPYFHGCDGHWTEAGARLAFEAIRRHRFYAPLRALSRSSR